MQPYELIVIGSGPGGQRAAINLAGVHHEDVLRGQELATPGFLAPSRGEVTIGGTASWHNPDIYRVLGLVPERDSVYAFLTGEDFVRATARLHTLPDPEAAQAVAGQALGEIAAAAYDAPL